jgi:hypothetical protein
MSEFPEPIPARSAPRPCAARIKDVIDEYLAKPDGQIIGDHMEAVTAVLHGPRLPPPAKPLTAGFLRIENGVAAEHWDTADYVRLYQSFRLSHKTL